MCVYEEEEKRQTVSIIGIFHAVLEANVLDSRCGQRQKDTSKHISVLLSAC